MTNTQWCQFLGKLSTMHWEPPIGTPRSPVSFASVFSPRAGWGGAVGRVFSSSSGCTAGLCSLSGYFQQPPKWLPWGLAQRPTSPVSLGTKTSFPSPVFSYHIVPINEWLSEWINEQEGKKRDRKCGRQRKYFIQQMFFNQHWISVAKSTIS